MDVMTARRIVHYVDDLHMSMERLAGALDCSTREACTTYVTARSIANIADAKRAVAKLNELAVIFGTTADELIRCYS